MSATIAFTENRNLTDLLGLHDTVPVVRSHFQQPGIRFAHTRLPEAVTAKQFIDRLLEQLRVLFPGQAIVFRRTIAEINAQFDGQPPDCASYNGFAHRAEHEAKWLREDAYAITATGTMANGVSNLRCNVALLVNIPPDLYNYAQAAGRTFRSGQESLVLFVTTHGFQYLESPNVSRCSGAAMAVIEGKRCRRHCFGTTFNNRPQTCENIGGYTCDVCEPKYWLFERIEEVVDSCVTGEPLSPPRLPSTNSSARVALRSKPQTPATETVISVPTTTKASVANQIHAKLHQIEPLAKTRRGQYLRKLWVALEGKCVSCWAFTGEFHPAAGHRKFRGCNRTKLDTLAEGLGEPFKNFRISVPDYQGCFRCGFPDDE
jgi:hypothetical protein